MKTDGYQSGKYRRFIELADNCVAKAFDKIQSGDRTDLLSGKLFETKLFKKLDDETLMAIRKHIKVRQHDLQVALDNLPLDQSKDLLCESMLCDALKDCIKGIMTSREEEKNRQR